MATHSLYSTEGVQNRLKRGISHLDVQLSQFEYCKEFEHRTGIPKTYGALGIGAVFAIMILFNIAGRLLTHVISWIYPAYVSFKAIESPATDDDKQWLTYWTVIGFVHIVEFFSDILLFWIPFYFMFKTVFVLWLTLPQFRGAETLYARFIRPYLLEAQTDIDRQTEKIKEKVGHFASELASKKD